MQNAYASQKTIASLHKQLYQYYVRVFSQEPESSQASNKPWYFLSNETSKNW
jgi:hypothetical protein